MTLASRQQRCVFPSARARARVCYYDDEAKLHKGEVVISDDEQAGQAALHTRTASGLLVSGFVRFSGCLSGGI